MALIKNSVVNSGGNPIMLQGLDSEIPQAAVVGRLFVAIDTLIIYRDNGSTWDVVGGGGGGTQNLDDVLLNGNVSNQAILLTNNEGDSVALIPSDGFSCVVQGVACIIGANGFETDGGGFSIINRNNDESLQAGGGYIALTSSTYTPTLTPSSNCASVTLIAANWSRIANVVTVSILMNVTPSVGGLNTGVQAISLPVSFSIYNRYQARGVVYDTLTQSVIAVSGFNSGSSSTTIFFTPVTNNVQSVSIEFIYSGTP